MIDAVDVCGLGGVIRTDSVIGVASSYWTVIGFICKYAFSPSTSFEVSFEFNNIIPILPFEPVSRRSLTSPYFPTARLSAIILSLL